MSSPALAVLTLSVMLSSISSVPIGSRLSWPSLPRLYHLGSGLAPLSEKMNDQLWPPWGSLIRGRDRSQPILADRHGGSLVARQAERRAVAADQRGVQLGRRCFLEGKPDGPRAQERLERQPGSQRVGTKHVAGTVEIEDRRVQELLGRRIPAAVAVQVDPDPVLRVGQESVAIAVHPPHGAGLARHRDGPFQVSRGGIAERSPGRAQAKDDGARRGLRLFSLDHRHIQGQAPLNVSPGASLRAGHAIALVDLAVAIGIDIEVDIAGPHLIEHDRHANRPGAAEANLGIAPVLAAVGNLLGHVFGLLAAEHERPERRMLEGLSWRGQDEPPGTGPRPRRAASPRKPGPAG